MNSNKGETSRAPSAHSVLEEERRKMKEGKPSPSPFDDDSGVNLHLGGFTHIGVGCTITDPKEGSE